MPRVVTALVLHSLRGFDRWLIAPSPSPCLHQNRLGTATESPGTTTEPSAQRELLILQLVLLLLLLPAPELCLTLCLRRLLRGQLLAGRQVQQQQLALLSLRQREIPGPSRGRLPL